MCYTNINGIMFLIWSGNYALLAYKKAFHFCISTLYPVILQHLLFSSRRFSFIFVNCVFFFIDNLLIYKQRQFYFPYSVYILIIFDLCILVFVYISCLTAPKSLEISSAIRIMRASFVIIFGLLSSVLEYSLLGFSFLFTF